MVSVASEYDRLQGTRPEGEAAASEQAVVAQLQQAPRPDLPKADWSKGPGLAEAPRGDDGLLAWHAQTVPELTDAVRWLASRLSAVTPAPDLSPRVEALEAEVGALQTDNQALQAQVTDLGLRVDDLDARVTALENPPAP